MKLNSLNPWKIREKMRKEKEDARFNDLRRLMEGGKKEFGFEVSFIDDNTIHVRDAKGKEVAFSYPSPGISIKEYDRFIQQMLNKDSPLPSTSISLYIHTLSEESDPLAQQNIEAEPVTLEKAARIHNISPKEMFNMDLFARAQIYARYKARLRDKED